MTPVTLETSAVGASVSIWYFCFAERALFISAATFPARSFMSEYLIWVILIFPSESSIVIPFSIVCEGVCRTETSPLDAPSPYCDPRFAEAAFMLYIGVAVNVRYVPSLFLIFVVNVARLLSQTPFTKPGILTTSFIYTFRDKVSPIPRKRSLASS